MTAPDEKLTITEVVHTCRVGLSAAGVSGELLIVDASTNKTHDLAREAGARLLQAGAQARPGSGLPGCDSVHPQALGPDGGGDAADCTYEFCQPGAVRGDFRAATST